MAMSILLKTMMNKNMNRVIKKISQVTEELNLCLKLNSKNSLDFDFMHIHLAILTFLSSYSKPKRPWCFFSPLPASVSS